jgi:SAM-dependent methyltransferase
LAVDADGISIYESASPVFFADGNTDYYLSRASQLNAQTKLRLLEKWVPAGSRVLDVGAGFGHFLQACGGRYNCVGAEVSPVAVAWSERSLGVRSICASVYDLAPEHAGPFDAITLWDVIEHLPDPHRALAALADRMITGGTLLLTTPDAGSSVARVLGRHWYYLDPVQHLVVFNRHNLTDLLRQHGFETVSIKTMGHHYVIGYVLSRIAYFCGGGRASSTLQRAAKAAARWRDHTIALNPRDVMAVVAVRRR